MSTGNQSNNELKMKNFKMMFVSCETDQTTLHKIQAVISSRQKKTVITQLSFYC